MSNEYPHVVAIVVISNTRLISSDGSGFFCLVTETKSIEVPAFAGMTTRIK